MLGIKGKDNSSRVKAYYAFRKYWDGDDFRPAKTKKAMHRYERRTIKNKLRSQVKAGVIK